MVSLPGQIGDPRVERTPMIIKLDVFTRRNGTTGARLVVVVEGLSLSMSRAQHSKTTWLVNFAFAEYPHRHPLQFFFHWLDVSTDF
jgi:hypothetical protein